MADTKLTISILVSGRDDTTRKSLQSLKPIRQSIATELILVDTGCSRELHTWLETQADEVLRFTWCNDFAKARNAGLQRAKGEWFLYLDDDEWFEETSALVAFLQSENSNQYEQAVYKVRNYLNKEGTLYTDEWVSRMIRIRPETHFEGKVHEYLTPALGQCKKLDMYAHHYGYVFENERARRAHFERNARLLLALVEEEPDNLKWHIQLIQEYANLGDWDKLLQESRNMLECIRLTNTQFVNLCRGIAYIGILIAWSRRENYTKMLESAQQFLQDERNPKFVACALHWYLLFGTIQTHNGAQQAKSAKEFILLYREYVSAERDEQQQIIEESMPLVKDVVTEGNYKNALMLHAAALVQEGKASEISDRDICEICNDLAQSLSGNGEFLFVAEEYWILGEAGVIPLEDMLLNLPLSQWMAMAMVLEQSNSLEKWALAEHKLQRICTREDLRYTYFDMKSINSRILLMEDAVAEYEQMKGLLEEYVICNLRYANSIYTQEALSGEMDILEDHCRAAVWIDRMLECDANDWTGQLENLKHAAAAWPKLGDVAKRYAALIARQQESQEQQAKEAGDKLQKMASEVKQQVITMTENGMYAEALGIVKQLRQMLPNDEDFIYLEQELENILS